MVEGYLLDNRSTLLPLIEIIVKEWCDWISSLCFIPLAPLWVWELDSRWESICQRLFPNCVIINGSLASLPDVDIMLLSRTSLKTCGINLSTAPFSLLLTSTGNVPVNSDWKKMRWSTPHTKLGGGTTGVYSLFSLHRNSYYLPPPLLSLPELPAENIHRVVDENVSSSSVASSPPDVTAKLFLVDSHDSIFRVCSLFFTTKWQLRQLNRHEVLRFWDYPDSLISSLNGRHRNILWDCILTGGIPFRVLGLVLRFLLVPYVGTGGGSKCMETVEENNKIYI